MYYQTFMYFLVDPLGLEPRTTEPKSAVLPITPWVYPSLSFESDRKNRIFLILFLLFSENFSEKDLQ